MQPDALYVEETLIDLPSGFRFALTIGKIELGDLSTRNVDFTNTVILPWTPTNERKFGHLWNEKAGTRIPYTKMPCRLVQDGQETIADGRLIVTGADARGVAVSVYENLIDVFDAVAGRKLNELSHIAVSGWDAPAIDTARLNTSGLIAAILNWGRAGAIYQFDYFLPCWFYHSFVTEALKLTGLTLSGDILTQAKFTDLVIPYSRPKFEYPVGANELAQLIAPLAFPTAEFSGAVLTDGATNFPALVNLGGGTTALWEIDGDDLVLKDTGRGTARWLTMSITAVSTTISVNAWAPGDVITIKLEIYHPTLGYSYVFTYTADEAIYGPAPVLAGLFPGGFPTASQTQLISIGDGTRIRVYVDGATTPAAIGIDAAASAAQFSAIVATTIDRAAVTWMALVPDMLMTDLLRDFTIRFGIIYRQVAGTLILKTIEEIATDVAGAVDWTSKRVNRSKESIDYRTAYGQRNTMKYQDEADDPELGTGAFVLANDTLQQEKNFYTSPFGNAKTASYSGGNKALVNVYEGAASGITDFENEPGLRLLMLRAKAAGEGNITFNGVARSDYRVAYHVDPLESKDAGMQYFIDNQYRLLSRALDETMSPVHYYDLDAADIASYNSHRMIYDDGAYYIAIKVPNFIPGITTKLELFKLF